MQGAGAEGEENELETGEPGDEEGGDGAEMNGGEFEGKKEEEAYYWEYCEAATHCI